MKKYYRFFVIFFALSCWIPHVASAQALISLGSPEIKSISVGKQLTVSINIARGREVGGYQTTVEFDPGVLRYVSSTNGDYLPAGAFALPPVVSYNSVTIAAVSLQGPAPERNGTLATVTFEVIKLAAITIKLPDFVLADPNSRALEVIVDDATIVWTPNAGPKIEGPRVQTIVSTGRIGGAAAAGPKIEGPWVWTIVSTGRIGGAAAAASGTDYLARVSSGTVTEKQIATNGVMARDTIGNKVWVSGKIAPTGSNNITEMLNTIGLSGNRDDYVAYGSISLNVPRRQNTTMYVGSDDAVKVWLNGILVHDNPVIRAASDYQDAFPVTLKKGKNILLVAVYERAGGWSGFFGFKRGTAYSLLITPVVKVGAAQRPPMYWIDANSGTLHRLVGNEVENFVPEVQNATSLAIDSTGNKIYWIEQTGSNRGNIKNANLDGSNVQVLATLRGSVPRSIAVDTMRGKLYWTNSRGRIQRSNLNGKQIRTIIQNLKSPDNITIDVAGTKLYWTEASGRIRRANLNGKSIQNIASGLGTLSDIAVSGNRLYWTEITGTNSGKIGRANLNGSNFGTLATLRSAPANIAVDAVGNKLYWTDSDGNIRRANLNGRNIKQVVSSLPSLADLALGSASDTTAAAPANSSLASSETPTPDATQLLTNYPNPFNPETWIPYQLAEPADVTLTIYGMNGEVVRQLALGHQAAGVYQSRSRAAYWDGKNELGEPVASGIYFYTLIAGDFTATRKMLIRK